MAIGNLRQVRFNKHSNAFDRKGRRELSAKVAEKTVFVRTERHFKLQILSRYENITVCLYLPALI